MLENKKIKIFNGSVISPEGIIDNGCVFICAGKIESIHEGNIEIADCLAIDAKGNYISPGFIDIHTHGAGGYDFMDGTCEAFIGSAVKHSQYGTTSLVPTATSGSMADLKEMFGAFRKAKSSLFDGANLLGLHLEGPYFSLEQKGAQDARYIKAPDERQYKQILSLTDDIIRWSAAPELKGSKEFGRFLSGKGILASIAHTNAVYDEVAEAFDNGFTHVTHLYSATSTVRRINLYRHAGVVEAAYLIDGMTVEIIADGSHLPGELIKLVYKIKGPDKTAIVTDSMRAAGMPEGESILGSLKDGQKVIVEDGVAKLMDKTAFAGSVATADRLVRTVTQKAGIPLLDAIKMITATPARIIGVSDKKGSLKKGYDADIVIFNNNIEVQTTIVGGEIVFAAADQG